MQTRTSLWEMLASSGDFALETKLIIDNTEYTEISAPIIDRALCKDTIEVGNCIAGSLTVAVRTADTFPTGAAVEVWKRVWNGSRDTSSEWITAGTFYISKRQKDYSSGLVSLTCYDAMLKGAENFYLDDPTADLTGWPHSMSEVVTYIAGRMGVQIDSRTTLRTETRYRITATPQGTLLDVLGHIGACMGGNWTITPEGKLRLVQLTTAPTPSDIRADRVHTVTELGETYTRWGTVDSNNVEHYGDWIQENGYVVLANEDPDPTSDAEIAAILSRLGTSDAITITKITMSDDLESVTYTAGTDTGYVLAITGNPYCSQEICNDLLQTLGGIEYHPFNADKAIYDPAAELGDPVLYKDIYYSTLMTEKANLNVAFRGDIGAPSNKEIEDEYPYKSPEKKDYQKAAAMANNARKEAINYLSRDDSGIMVARMTDENRYTPANVPSGVKNTFIDNSSFQVRDGTDVLAKFGVESQIGQDQKSRLRLRPTGMNVYTDEDADVFNILTDVAKINTRLWYSRAIEHSLMSTQEYLPLDATTVEINLDDITSNTDINISITMRTTKVLPGVPRYYIIEHLKFNNLQYGTSSTQEIYVPGQGSCKVKLTYNGNAKITINSKQYNSSYDTTKQFPTLIELRYGYERALNAPSASIGTRENEDTRGAFSVILGEGLSAGTRDQVACGRYNEDTSDYVFMVGNGTEGTQSNAFAVTWDGNQLMALDETATSGTDAALYGAITALGWESEVIV